MLDRPHEAELCLGPTAVTSFYEYCITAGRGNLARIVGAIHAGKGGEEERGCHSQPFKLK